MWLEGIISSRSRVVWVGMWGVPGEADAAGIFLKLGIIEALLDRDCSRPRGVPYFIATVAVGRNDLISLIDHSTGGIPGCTDDRGGCKADVLGGARML